MASREPEVRKQHLTASSQGQGVGRWIALVQRKLTALGSLL